MRAYLVLAVSLWSGCGRTMQVTSPAYLRDIPFARRTVAGAQVATPAARPDLRGVGFAGGTSADNRYTLDGADITSPRTGRLGHDVPLEFLEELSLVTGGALPGAPTAIGGVVNATTRSGSNEWHGNAFGWLDRTRDGELGATLSGPIVRDHAWFFAGLAPTFGDTRQVPALLRVDVAVTPQHQVAVSTLVTGDDADVIGHERSHFHDEKTVLDALIAWHREVNDSRASGRLELLHRLRLGGWHELSLGAARDDASAVYARDLWQVSSNLTVDAGLRVEDPLRGDLELAPRVGVAYDPTREGLAKLFVHGGRYYDQLRPTYIDELLAGVQAEVGETLLGMTFQQRAHAYTYDGLEFSLSRRVSSVLVSAAYTLAYAAEGIVPPARYRDAKLDAIYSFSLGRTLSGTVAARASSTGLDAHVALQRHFQHTTAELFIEAFDLTQHSHATPNARLGARLAF